jgi:hypothetical protein
VTLREALQSVYDKHGALTPALVVEEARDGTDAAAELLRGSLTWDKDEALERYQLVEASRLIRKAKIAYRPTENSSLRDMRAFMSIPEPQGRAYHPADVVAQDPFKARLALQEAERAWRDLKKRYGNIAGFFAMVQHDVEGEQEVA